MIVTATDVYGQPLARRHDIWLERLDAGGRRQVARNIPPNGRAEFESAPTTDYRVRVVAEGYVTASKIVDGAADEVAVAVPVDPSAVVGYAWPVPMPEVPGIDWPTLDDGRRAAALNVWGKLFHTPLGVMPASAYVDEVLEVRVDRLICRVAPALLAVMDQAVAAKLVDVVPSGVGHEPPAGYQNRLSIKTRDKYGSLQITIAVPDDAAAGGPPIADIDVDEERTFVHAFRALGHTITGGKTDAVEVQQILAAQGVDVGWRPRLA